MALPNSDVYELVVVDGQHFLYDRNVDTYKPMVQLIEEENKENDKICENGMQEEKKVWTNELTLILINLVGEFDDQFQNSIKKYVWIKIAQRLKDKLGTSMTWQQCDTKWKGLLKTYKDIKEHNSTSGKNRRRWEYFEVMHKILYKKPEITPIATCSSAKGLVVNKELSNNNESTDESTIVEDNPNDFDDSDDLLSTDTNNSNKKRKCSTSSIPFSKKRLATSNVAERRHREKMERQDKFLQCFQEYVNIIGNKTKETNE